MVHVTVMAMLMLVQAYVAVKLMLMNVETVEVLDLEQEPDQELDVELGLELGLDLDLGLDLGLGRQSDGGCTADGS